MYAAVRIRGEVGVREKISDTLEMLNLRKKFNCTLLPETDDYKGMLKKVGDFVAWGEVDEEIAEKILRRGGVEDIEEVVEGLSEGRSLSKMDTERRFGLTPPSGGFKKSTKEVYPKGEAGYRGEDINGLLERMV